MAQLKSNARASEPRAAGSKLNQRSPSPLDATHVVLCTEDILHLSPVIHTLAGAGYVVTAWASNFELVSRLTRLNHPVELLVIDGRGDALDAWATATQVRAAFADLPIVLLLKPEAELRLEAARLGIRCVFCSPFDPWELVALAFALAPVVHDFWSEPRAARAASR